MNVALMAVPIVVAAGAAGLAWQRRMATRRRRHRRSSRFIRVALNRDGDDPAVPPPTPAG